MAQILNHTMQLANRSAAQRAAYKAGLKGQCKVGVNAQGHWGYVSTAQEEVLPVLASHPETIPADVQLAAPVAQVLAAWPWPKAPAKEVCPVANGVKRPKAGGLCAQVWAFLDEHTSARNLKALRVVAGLRGWNVNNVACEFYAWRKHNGINKANANAA